jgi:outer membrane protein OmpU
VKFTLSGTTDGGLEFGGAFKTSDLRGDANQDPRNGSRGSVFVSGAFGKIEMGDVVSAPEALFGDLAEVGYLGDDQGTANGTDFTNDIPYLTLDNETQSALLYTYSSGAFSVAASMTDGHGYATSSASEAQAYAVAGAYTFGNYTVGLGYEDLDLGTGLGKATQTELAGTAKFGNTDVKAYYAAGGDENPVDNAYGISAASVFGATTVSGYVQQVSLVAGDDVTWYGIGAAYDLGGGAVLAGAIQDDDINGSDPTANVGVKFKF